MNAPKITFIRMTCYGYAKNIPLQKNHKNFLMIFKKLFEINDTIQEIKFEISFYDTNTKMLLVHQPLNNEEQYALFIKDQDLIDIFNEISGIAYFEGSSYYKKDKKSDPIIKQGTILEYYYFEDSENNINLNYISKKTINEKLMEIDKLNKEINELQKIYDIEIRKNHEYKRNEGSKNHQNNDINNKEIKIEKVKIEFYNEKETQNIIVKDISEINEKPIEYKVKLLIQNDKENIPENVILKCIFINPNIYFSDIKFNDESKVKKYLFLFDKIIYVIMINIIFKNKKSILCGEYLLKLKLQCDTDEKYNNIDIGNIIIKIEDKLMKKNK